MNPDIEQVLCLNADYAPIRAIPWQQAIELLLEGKAVAVESVEGRFVRSRHLTIPWPSVVAMRRYSPSRGRIKYSGRNVMARDVWTCLYCGDRPRRPDGSPDRAALTIDHVIPRSKARNYEVYAPWVRRWVPQTCWLNAVTACKRCNQYKADRTPEQAEMVLRALPREPTRDDVARMNVSRIRHIPTQWLAYLPASWRSGLGLSAPVSQSDVPTQLGAWRGPKIRAQPEAAKRQYGKRSP